MNSSHFNSLFNCSFRLSDEEMKLMDIAKQYHDACDAFDAKACSGRCQKTGEPMPINKFEHYSINSNAYLIKRRLYSENPDISPSEIRKAIQIYQPA